MREYQNSYIAYLDLLGFKQLMSQNRSCEEIAQIFDEIRAQYSIRQNGEPLVPENSMQYKVMSDSICIHISSDIPNALAALIHECTYFQVRMLRFDTPILVRGAIVQGNIYSDSDVIFGQGLIDAYMIEENYAKYPRIIMPMELVDKNIDSEHITNLFTMNLLFKDFDYVYCIDYLRMFYGWEHSHGKDKKLATHIYKMLNESFDESVRDKYLYLQSRFLLYYKEEG